MLFFLRHKTAYGVRISDWSSDVCSSDLIGIEQRLDISGVGRLRGRDVIRSLEGLDENLRARVVQLLVELRRSQHALDIVAGAPGHQLRIERNHETGRAS